MNEQNGRKSSGIAWPLAALALLVAGWVAYISFLAVARDSDPDARLVICARVVGGLFLLIAAIQFLRARRANR